MPQWTWVPRPDLPKPQVTGFLVMIRSFLLVTAALLTTTGVSGASAADSHKAGDVFKDCATCGEMVVIPAGSNVLGSTVEEQVREGVPPTFAAHEGPQVMMTIKTPFAMAKTETTRGQFAAFVAETKRPDPAECAVHDAKTDSWGMQPGFNWHHTSFPQEDSHPVTCVSWNDATAYAAWLSKKTGKKYRLPTDSEWEYGARGGTRTARYWGDNAADLCLNANIATADTVAKFDSTTWEDKLVCTSKHSFTMPVGSFDANPYGLQDMLGNVWEWTADCYHTNHSGVPTDGSAYVDAECKTHGVRGGAYHSQIWLARAATRGDGMGPDAHIFAAGFRVARDLD